ncbi:MAG TPA: PAS domain S-box protein [Usitatibacter sp.]|jgi:hypothetical protein|nr:PAS domain S-box protein [Usitatibacter sp.]
MRQRLRLGPPVAIWAGAALLIAGLWAAALHFIAADREQAIASAQREHANLAFTLGEHNSRALRNVETALRNAAKQWEQGREPPERDPDRGHLVGRILLADAAGRIVAGDGRQLDASGQEYFRAARDSRSRALHVSAPITGRISGTRIIPLSLRLEDASGRFGGVIAASLTPSYFSRLYGQADLGSHGSVVLMGTDGIVRAARAHSNRAPGEDASRSQLLRRQKEQPDGHFRAPGLRDGIPRYFSYHTLGEYPSLVIAVGRSEADVLAAHQRMATMGFALAAFASAVIAALAGFAAFAVRRQRRHMDALAASEARFRDIYEHAVEGIYRTTRDGRVVAANPAMARMAGYDSPEQFMAAVNVCDTYRRPELRAKLQEIIDTHGRVSDFEYELLRRDGTFIWASLNARGVPDESGRVTHYEGFITDITGRKREEEMREQASQLALRRYRELLARLGILAVNLGEAADVHGIYRAVLAFARESAPVDGLFVSLLDGERRERHRVFAWRDGRQQDVAALPPLPMTSSPHSRAIATGCVVVTDDLRAAPAEPQHHGAGSAIDARPAHSSLVVPMQVMGRVIGGLEVQSVQPAAYREEHVVALQVAAPFIAMALDNVRLLAEERAHRSRAEQAERRSAAIVDSAMDAIITIDVDGRVVDFNPAAEKLFGIPRRQALGRSMTDLVVPAWLRDEYREALDECLHEGRTSVVGTRVETTALRGDGHVFPVEVSVTRVPASDPPLVTAFLRDITERQRAVLALRQSEARYREAADELAHVIDGSLDAICVFDEEGRFLRVSAACQLIWGHAPAELVGHRLLDMVHPDDAAKTLESGRRVKAGQATREFENRCVRADGHVAHVMWSARWRAEDRTILCVARDVTQGKLMAEANRHLASRLHEALENLTSGFATLDRNWRVTYVNRHAETVLGLARETLVGGIVWDVVPGLTGSPFETQYRRAMDERVTVEFQDLLPLFGRWFEVRAYPTVDGGLALYFHDVTERQRALRMLEESERRFEHVALATSDAVWDWCRETGALWWSEGLKALFGYEADGEMARLQGWIDAIHPEDRDRIVASYHDTIDSGAARWSSEYRFRRQDGTYAFVMDHASILRDEAGRAVRLVGGMTDITERRELERQLMRTQRIESLGTLAGGIAHDLNNVFTPIMMGLDLLDGDAAGEGAEIVAMLRTSAMRGAEMVKQVLHFARGMEGERLEVKPRLLYDEIERMIRETFPRNIEMHVRCDARLATVTGDPTQLHQVLLNLCVNARDAMPRGGKLMLRAREARIQGAARAVNGEIPPGHYVVLEVQDDGCGIGEAVLERIFDPFFTTKAHGEGTGLGLSTSLAIVRKHQGFMQVTSEPGAGSRFCVYLPANETARPAERAPDFPPAAHAAGETILLVEDEAGIRELARRALEAAGYRVVTAEHGAAALAAFRDNACIDLVVTDMMMPVMDGARLARALGELAPAVPVICTSGIAPAGPPAAALTGAAFLAKPYTSERLLAAVRKALPDRAAA